jgi:hypothetical protein
VSWTLPEVPVRIAPTWQVPSEAANRANSPKCRHLTVVVKVGALERARRSSLLEQRWNISAQVLGGSCSRVGSRRA